MTTRNRSKSAQKPSRPAAKPSTPAPSAVVLSADNVVDSPESVKLATEWRTALTAPDAVAIVSGHTLTEADAVGITLAIRNLEREQDGLSFGQAVGIYAVRQSFPTITQAQLGEHAGIGNKRVSQLEKQGEAFVRLGITDTTDPAHVSAATAVRKLTDGRGGKGAAERLEAVISGRSRNKLAAIVAAAVKPKPVEGESRGAQTPGGRKVAETDNPTGGEGAQPGTVPDTRSDAERVADNMSRLVDSCAWLTDHAAILTPAQRKTADSACMVLLGALEDATAAAKPAKDAASKAS